MDGTVFRTLYVVVEGIAFWIVFESIYTTRVRNWYAYLLARLEPKGKDAAAAYRKFADRMYEWSLDAENRRRLITAIYLWVYENRKRK